MEPGEAQERFTALYDRYFPQVGAYAVSRAGRQLAEEVVSQTFTVAWRRRAAIGPMLHETADGLYCPAGDFYIDPWGAVERAVITHAHGDHLGDHGRDPPPAPRPGTRA